MKSTRPLNTQTIKDEVLRSQIRKIIDEPKRTPKWERFTKNPLVAIILGFILTGVIGTALTNNYNAQQRESERARNEAQKEREHERDLQEQARAAEQARAQKEVEVQRNQQQKEVERIKSFSDAINKTRIEKIGLVWEKISLYETAAQEGIDKMTEVLSLRGGNSTMVEIIQKSKMLIDAYIELGMERDKLYKDLTVALAANRFWLGDDNNYTEIRKYIDVTDNYLEQYGNYIIERRFKNTVPGGLSERDFKMLDRERKKHRANVMVIMKKMLNDQ